MTGEQAREVLAICDLNGFDVQITKSGNLWTADFRKDHDARTVSTEMLRRGHELVYNPEPFYARLV